MLHVSAAIIALAIPHTALWCVVLVYGWYGYEPLVLNPAFSIEESLIFSVFAYLLFIGFLNALTVER